MNELKIFENNEFGQVRTILMNDEPWFVGKDVADILGYQNGSRDINRHVDEEDRHKVMLFDGNQDKETIVINESGFYSLILSSKMPNAKKFKHWVTSEILPAIRKHGVYATDELLNNPDFLIEALTELKAEREARQNLEEKHKENAPKVLFAESVTSSNQTILVGDLAKILKQNGVDIGQNRLFKWLRKNGYLISRKGESFNMPTQKSMDLGLFRVKESTHNNPDGSIRLTKTTKVTGKGQVYFTNKFLACKRGEI